MMGSIALKIVKERKIKLIKKSLRMVARGPSLIRGRLPGGVLFPWDLFLK